MLALQNCWPGENKQDLNFELFFILHMIASHCMRDREQHYKFEERPKNQRPKNLFCQDLRHNSWKDNYDPLKYQSLVLVRLTGEPRPSQFIASLTATALVCVCASGCVSEKYQPVANPRCNT